MFADQPRDPDLRPPSLDQLAAFLLALAQGGWIHLGALAVEKLVAKADAIDRLIELRLEAEHLHVRTDGRGTTPSQLHARAGWHAIEPHRRDPDRGDAVIDHEVLDGGREMRWIECDEAEFS